MSKKEVERNKYIITYKQKHPKASYADIGVVFGITRQRVYKILKDCRGINGR